MNGDAHKILILKEILKNRHLAVKILIETNPLFYLNIILHTTDKPYLLTNMEIDFADIIRVSKSGNLEMLKWIYRNLQNRDYSSKGYSVYTAAAKKGHLHIVKWIREGETVIPVNDIVAFKLALEKGRLNVAKWIYGKYMNFVNGSKISLISLKIPIKRLDILVWINEICEPEKRMELHHTWLCRAIKRGYLETLIWLRSVIDFENMILPGDSLMRTAILNYYFKTIKYLRTGFGEKIINKRYLENNLIFIIRSGCPDTALFSLNVYAEYVGKKNILEKFPDILTWADNALPYKKTDIVNKFFQSD